MSMRRGGAVAEPVMDARQTRDRRRRRRLLLLCATILGGAAPVAAHAQTAPAGAALPSGGTVVSGQASISQAGGALAIHQSGDRAIIDWNDFSIGEQASVVFNNGSGATLNRVSGGSVSTIDGLLRATGSVYLVNPNGIVIGARGVVETGGSFIASTLDLPDAAFLGGGSMTFTGTSRARVVNLGRVGALGGNVALIGATVENRGSVSAANGTAGLIAGSKVLIRDGAHDGGGLFSVLYGDASTSAANGGAIDAANVELRAQQGNVYALAGNTAGTINATGVRTGDGKVWLVSDAGTTAVAGTIQARGASGSAGAIETSGHLLHIGNSSIDAQGGTWLIDPEDLIVDSAAATTINGTLGNNTSVTLTTTASGASAYGNGVSSGAGDILINAGLSWNTGATLTLDSYHGIAFNADIAVNGAGAVVLKTNQGGSGGDLTFASGSSIAFADGHGGQSLTINGTAYSLLYSWSDLQAISGQSGAFALAHDLLTAGFTAAPVTSLSGTLEGLGNTVADMSISPHNISNVGLIGTINAGAVARDLVVGATILDWSTNGSSRMGVLAGTNNGTIQNVATFGSVMTGDGNYIGGLVGRNAGVVRNTSSSASVTGDNGVGGLVGQNLGQISASYATGDPWGAYRVGGLVGEGLDGSITDSYATGPVIANIYYVTSSHGYFAASHHAGGLVGLNYGTITRSYATGSVSGSSYVGGLVGAQHRGSISIAYATGAVTAISMAGGLVGAGLYSSSISNSYSTSAVTGTDTLGGLAGYSAGTIENSYATGTVTGTGLESIGGVVGVSAYTLTMNGVRWDSSTTYQSRAVGNQPNAHGATSMRPSSAMSASTFAGWDLDTTGGQSTVWRLYEGSTAPLLKAFLQTANVTLAGGASVSVVYDGTNQAGRFTTTVLDQRGNAVDAAKILGTASFACSGGDASCSNVGSYGVRATGGLYSTQSGYDLVFSGATASLGITARPLAVTANDRTMVYGDAAPALTYAVGAATAGTGLVNGDTLSGALATSASATSGVGSYAIGQGTLSAGANYALSFTGANLSVTPRALAVTANDRTMVYGDSAPTLTYAVGGRGLVNGDTLSGALTTAASATSATGSYAIGQGTLSAGGNYAVSFTGGTMSVTARPLTVAATDRTMVYGESLPSLAYTIGGGGLVNGDTLSGALATSASATSAVGSYAIGQGSLAASPNYALSFTGGSVSVTRRTVAVTATDRTMVYGDSVPALSYSVGAAGTGTGLINGDTLSGALATSASATSAVGSYAIGLGSLSAGANYALNFTGANLSVAARPLAVTANDRSMVYGDAVPTLTYAVGGSGLVNGDTLSGALATGASATSAVGSYAIGLGSLSAGVNYALNFTGANLSVTARPLAVTANDRTMVYGDAVPTLTYAVGGSGLVNGDTLSGTLATAASATSGVGSYAIGQGSLSAGANYALNFTGATVSVSARQLAVTANDRTMVYGDAVPTLTYAVGGAGLVNGDTLSGALTTGASATSGIGSYAIGQGTLSAGGNYAVSFTGANVSVTARPLAVTANDRTMVYGDAVPMLTYAVGGSGLVNGDALSGALTTVASAASGVGSYAIGQGSLTASPNYALNFTGASVSVTPRPLAVTAADRTMIYGESLPTLTYTVGTTATGTGLVNGDTLSGVLATGASATSGVGSYAIGQGTLRAGANYTLDFTGATVSVTPRPLVVTAADRTMVYGDGLPTLAYAVGATATGTGLVNGDTLSGVLATSASATSGVGSYAVGQGSLNAGANYALDFTGANLSVTARPLTVTASDRTMVYGDAAPTLTYAVGGSGLVNGDTLSGALATAASATSGIGSYAIGLGNLTASPNYALRFTGGSVSVTPRALTVTANDRAMVYGDAAPTLTYAVGGAGLVNGDTLSGALTTGASATSGIGSYAIGQGTLSAGGNYAVSFTGANVSVTARPLTVTANDRTMVYGDAVPMLTYAVGGSGLVNGDTMSGMLATPASAASGVGSYAIGQGSLTASANYTLNFTGASVTVTARPLAVTAADRTMIYGEPLPSLTYAVGGSGLVNGDTLSGALATAATQASGVGGYAISQGTLRAGSNYTLDFTGGTLSVTPRALVVTATDRAMVYGDALPALTYAVGATGSGTGLVLGDTLSGALTTAASATSGVGSYAIGQGTLSASPNYALRFTGASVAVTPRPLTVTANDRTMVYGDAAPTLTYAVGGSGLVNGDTLSGALASGAGQTSVVGSYAIGLGTLGAGSNYALRFTAGRVSVTPRALTIVAEDQVKLVGTALDLGGAAFQAIGLVNGDRVDTVLLASDGAAADAPFAASPYAITVSDAVGARLANYAITYQSAPTGLTLRAPDVRPNPITIRLAGDVVPAGNPFGITGTGPVRRSDGAVAMPRWPSIFFKQQN